VSARLLASETRTWTDSNGKTLEAKIVGFEKASFKLSRKLHAIYVNDIRYSQLNAKIRKRVEHLTHAEGFKTVGDAIPKDSPGVKEFKYLNVIFRTSDGQTVKVPLDALQGSEEKTGDYQLAYDESQEWLRAGQEKQNAADKQAPVQPAPAIADPSDQDRRRLEEDRQKLDQERKQFEDERRRVEQEGRWRDDQDRRLWEEEMRRRQEEYRLRQEQWNRDKQRTEADRKKREDEAKARAALQKKQEDDRRRADAAQKSLDAQKRAEAERKKHEEEQKKQEEEKKKKDAGKKH
jgi:hypothetical protein